MPVSPVDIYRDLLPKTNCKECGEPTCLAFATRVVAEKIPLEICPYVNKELVEKFQKELYSQYSEGRWVKKDPAKEALVWAKERAASMKLSDLPERIGGVYGEDKEGPFVKLPYFNRYIFIRDGKLTQEDGSPLNIWEQVFVYNHMAQGGSISPKGIWKGLEQFPNTISKVKSMKEHVEDPLIKYFSGNLEKLKKAGEAIGGVEPSKNEVPSADVALLFRPLPKVPVMLLFWDEDPEEGFGARAKLLFDETIIEHLDIESIMFLSERLMQLLTGKEE